MDTSEKDREIYEFGEFRLNVAEHFLVRSGGERVQLSEKPFDTLCILLRNAGHLVSKDELLNQVWADSFVEENNLNKCIHAVRRALGEKPGEQQFIETVKKHGFRFVAEVRRVQREETTDVVHRENGFQSKTHGKSSAEFPPLVKQNETQRSGAVVALADWRREANGNEAVEQVSPSTTPEESTEQTAKLESASAKPNSESKHLPKYRLLLAAFALAAFLIGASALGYYFYGNKRVSSSADGKKSIAVLPLKPINTASRDEIYEIGIADSLIHKLGSMKGFVVRPLSATRKYTDIGQDPLAAGQEQKVDYVLASNYQLAGGKIRVTAQLFNVASGQIEETYKSEKEAGDVFAMQDAIAGEVGNNLSVRFGSTANNQTARRGTNNVEAYRLYLQGIYLYGKRNPKASKKAVELLEQAVRLDPNYALAWAGKAHAHRYAGNLGRDTDTHGEYQKSVEALNEALLLDKDLSEAYSALCENKYYYEWDFTGAERECRRAIELDPDSSMAHEIYGRYLLHRGRFNEAISELKTAIALDPTSLFNQRNLGIALYYAGHYDEAAAQFKQVIATDENFTTAYLWLRNALEMQGNYSEAFEWLMKAQTAINTDEETVQFYKTAYQTSGYQGVLRAQAERFEKGNGHFYIGAILNAQIGNKDKAFEYLEKSFGRREWGMNSLLVEPHLNSLRGDPRYNDLVRRVGMPQ